MTETMILGNLSLLSKHGVEIKTECVSSSSPVRDLDRITKDRHIFPFDLVAGQHDFDLIEPLPVIKMLPLSMPIEGDYITGTFRDAGFMTGPYILKAWLVLEETPKALIP